MKKIPYLRNSDLQAVNYIISSQRQQAFPFLFATRNQNKLDEYRRILKTLVEGVDLKVPEIQDSDPLKVLEEKARAAYVINNGPIFVEDSSLTIDSLDGMIGPFADNETNSRLKLRAICRMFATHQERTATVAVGIALFDGRDVFSWVGEVKGAISESPVGSNGFGFDPIFIPKNSKKTFAQMTDREKDVYSPRRIAVEKLLKNPPTTTNTIFPLQEPSGFQMVRIATSEIAKHPNALRFAFSLDSLSHAKPNAKLEVDGLKPFHKVVYADGAIVEYKSNPKSFGMGLVIIPSVDLKLVPDHDGGRRPVRLDVARPYPYGDTQTEPFFLQMGSNAIKLALASRAAEYIDMHASDMHQYIRDLASGKVPTIERSNTRSRVLEEILGMIVHTDEHGKHSIDKHATTAIATKELGYKRESHDGKLSRRAATKGILLLGPDGIVSSVYAMGGMPPVSGSVDSIVTAAMSYMRIWIPRNGIFAGNFERQLAVFKESVAKIRSFKLPKDIEKHILSQIGVAVGCENPAKIALQIKKFQKLGGHAVRIYTTNPDTRIVETAEAIYKAVGNNFLICVGPVTDFRQAKILHEKGHVRMFLAGHGGGENCTSLTAGGAANSIEILYEMYLDKLFNDSIIGLEGGTGTTIGALLPMLDVISLNRRGVGGIESTGGLYVRKTRNGFAQPVLPYHGSASAATQLIESYMNPEIAKRRLGLDGIVVNVEGKPNYMLMEDAYRSNVNRIREARSHVGLALADQKAQSMYQLRQKVAKEGHNHVGISPASSVIANEHRAGV